MLKRSLLAVSLLAAFSTGPADARSWELIAEESRLDFTASIQGRDWAGSFQQFAAAEMAFDPTAPENAAIAIAIPLESATLGTADVDKELRGETWFAAERHPEARFDVTSLTPTGGDRYDLTADLTLRGVTVPVAFPVTIRVDGDRASASGELVMNRTDHGVGQGEFEKPDTVAFEVTVSFSIEAAAR
ncbi:MAG: YceI family protein [Alphaproteobacteria bacterium]|nr:YceI family protein [Alphaproteobacteria bacterium]